MSLVEQMAHIPHLSDRCSVPGSLVAKTFLSTRRKNGQSNLDDRGAVVCVLRSRESAACGGGEGSKVGVVAPLTGFSTSYGKDEENAAKLAFEEANAQGLVIGGQRVRFEVDGQDDAGDPKIAVLVAQAVVQIDDVVDTFRISMDTLSI
jgi:ABC-type branched-subunit amino acid transport system substrate-binding protein